MAVYEHDLDAANTRIEELENELIKLESDLNITKGELAQAVVAAQAVQKTCDKLRAENTALTAGKTQGAEAAAKVAANLAAFQAGEL